MPRKAIPRITRPSGIEVSGNGNYYYWKCNVSGLETFAPEDRFNEVVAKYGSEEKLFKTYILRPVQKYIDRGFDAEHIKAVIKANYGKLPPLDANLKERKKALKKPRKKRLKQFAVGEMVGQITTESGSIEEVKQRIYPWTGNPDFFKSVPSTINIAEETKSSCMFPNRYLDDMCHGCRVYAECQSELKYTEADWKAPKNRGETKITPINPFADSSV